MLILMLLSRGAAGLPEPLYIAASYLFIPDDTYGSVDGVAFPLLTLGWTLNYEMLFYLVFGAFIVLPRRLATAGVQLTMLAAVLVGLLKPASVALATWTQPIVLEFALGLAIANAWRNGSQLSRGVAAGLVVGACVWIALDPAGLLSLKQTPNDMRRLIGWGLPAAMILAAALLGSWRLPARWERPADLLGDASYSLYLTHPFVLIALEHIWPRLFGARLPLLFVAVAVLLAIALAVVVNRWAERPFTAALTRRLTRPRAAKLAPQGELPAPGP
jgi:peptidoglycan/LPS O-acetylase OafA/YrhL